MLLIPAIDIINGKCVRLYQGNFSKVKEYSLNPLEQAKVFADLGFDHLHLIDLDGAKNGVPENLKILEQIVKSTTLKVDFGGGLRSKSSITDALNAGAWKVNLGSALLDLNVHDTYLNSLDKNLIIAAIDYENNMVKTNGWQTGTKVKVDEHISNLYQYKIKHYTITDIARDGTLTNPAFTLYSQIRLKFPHITLWTSGGISSIDHIEELKRIGIDGAIIGKSYYENRLNIKELLKCLQKE